MYSDAHRTFFQYLAQLRGAGHTGDYWDLYNGDHGSKHLRHLSAPASAPSARKLQPASRS